ncbi:MAG: protoglobin domain-containing protein [Myxococcota bacterium]
MAEAFLLQQLREYVGFDEDSAARLRASGPSLRPHFDVIVTEFYDAILADPGAREVLQDEAQIERLRVSLFEWLETLVTGPYDVLYFEKRARIGKVHVKVGLEQRYMLAAMNRIRVGLHRALLDEPREPIGDPDTHRAIDQICDIELAIMLETYREDYVLKKTAEAESLAIMGRLTTGLAHEVRNPLNAAKLQLDVMRRSADKIGDVAIQQKILKRASIVTDELNRLSLLLDDFLNLARARRLEPVPCDAKELLNEVVDLRRPEMQSQGVEVTVDLGRQPCHFMAERDRLKQVINNLITNAVEAVAGVRNPEIRISCRGIPPDRWEVAVEDNGPGIPQEVIDHAFESFVTTKEAGTGLGLAIVKRIVELHGGAARLESPPDGGARASFWIPVEP